MKLIFALLLLKVFAQAGRFEGGEPGPHRSCDQNAVNSCQEAARAAEQLCRARANDYESKENVINADLRSRGENLQMAQNAWQTAEQQAESVGAELQFLDDLEEKTAVSSEIFPGAPSLSNYFSVDQLSLSWRIKYPLQYRQKLAAQQLELAKSSQKFSRLKEEIENEINLMLPMQAFLSTEKNRWLNDVNVHVDRWQRACKQQICP